ncbi:hypothetical protein Bca4012_010861 [Brassica carinata]
MLTPLMGLSSTLKRLTAQAVVYLLWKERNNRLHQHSSESVTQLFRQLDRMIRDTLLARLNNKRCQGLLSQWFKHA